MNGDLDGFIEAYLKYEAKNRWYKWFIRLLN
jgi:hypothetical protein